MVQDIFAKDIKSAYGLFHEGILALALAERQGMRVDVTYINRQSERITRQIVGLETQFYFSKFFSDWKKSRKGKPSKKNKKGKQTRKSTKDKKKMTKKIKHLSYRTPSVKTKRIKYLISKEK